VKNILDKIYKYYCSNLHKRTKSFWPSWKELVVGQRMHCIPYCWADIGQTDAIQSVLSCPRVDYDGNTSDSELALMHHEAAADTVPLDTGLLHRPHTELSKQVSM